MSYFKELILKLTILVAVAFSVAGCVDNPDAPGGDATAYLKLRVATSDSRANDETFVDPDAASHELMHSLRIVIVRADGTVEYNRFIDLSGNRKGVSTTDWETFEVIANEGKTVYLFANESSLDPGDAEVVRSLLIGAQLPEGFDEQEISLSNGLTNMQDANGNDINLFMSRKLKVEASELQIEDVAGDHLPTVEKSVYIIRAQVKFSYFITNNSSNDITISQIHLDGMATKEYMMPTDINDVEATKPDANRMITRYSTPSDLEKRNLQYTVAPNIEVKAGSKNVAVPSFYYHEAPVWGENMPFDVPLDQTAESPYSTSIVLDNGVALWDGKFPNLPALPRNTHVKVYITVNDMNINCFVDVVPYFGVNLNPGFGFDELTPRPPIPEGETPPWVTIDPNA